MVERNGPPIGVEGHNVGRPDREPTRQAQQTHTLLDMSVDYEFFTTALISTAGRFDRDPVVEFNRVYPTTVKAELPFAIDYKAGPFFKGLGIGLCAGRPVNWDHRIYAIVRDRWEICRDLIGGIAIMDPRQRSYFRICFYELQIIDPTTLRKRTVIGEPPWLPITVFAVSGTKAFTWLAPPENPFEGLPYVKIDPPRPDIQLEGHSVLGPPPAPEKLLPQDQPQLPRQKLDIKINRSDG